MGSKISLELKEGHHCLEIDKSLVGEFQDRIFVTDKAMSSFVKAIDSTEAACEELLRRLHASGSSSAPGSSSSETDKEMELTDTQRAAKLLWSIKECVSDHKFVVLECFSKLVKLIIDTGSDFIQFGDVLDLSIDKYRGSHNMEDTPYYDTRIEMLQTDIDLLKQKLKQKEEEAEIFKATKLNFSKQQTKYLKRIDDLEKNVDTISNENAELNERIYLAKQKLEEHGIACKETKTDQSCPLFLEVKFENLKREIQLKNQMHVMEKEKVDILNERDRIHSQEKERYLKRIKELDKDVDTLVSMNKDLIDKLRYVQLEVENQSVAIDFLKNQKEYAIRGYEGRIKEEEEYREKVGIYFDEIVHIAEDIIPPKENTGEENCGSKENEATQQKKQESSQNEENEISRTKSLKRCSDRINNQVEKIRNHLKHVKEKIENRSELKIEDAGEERQIGKEIKFCKDDEEKVENHLRQTMHVQVYFTYGLNVGTKGEQMLLRTLIREANNQSVELRADVLRSPSGLRPEVPVLIFRSISYSYSDWSSVSEPKLLDKFTLSAKMALVTLHRKEKSILISSNGTNEESLLKLGGSFDFGYRKDSTEFAFDECSINDILTFIKSNNPGKIQVIEKHVLSR